MSNDHLTLDQIQVEHDDQLKLIIGKSKDRTFDNLQEAANYIKWCIPRALEKLGLHVDDKTPPDMIDGGLKAKRIEVQRFETIDKHSGVFIYKDNFLEYFISDMEKKKNQIIFHKEMWVVRSNVT